MSFRMVGLPKSVALNDLEARYFSEIGKPAFQRIIASVRIELIDHQKSASITATTADTRSSSADEIANVNF